MDIDVTLGCIAVALLIMNFAQVIAYDRLRKKRQKERTTLQKLSDKSNWGDITIMSSQNPEPVVYKTWVGDEDPQDLIKKILP